MQDAIPNVRVEYARAELAVPVGYWRSAGPSQNTFVLESFIDEMAHAAGRDPLEFRREMLAGNPRLRHLIEVAAEQSGWGTPLPAGRARGSAVVEAKGGRERALRAHGQAGAAAADSHGDADGDGRPLTHPAAVSISIARGRGRQRRRQRRR